MRTVVSGAPIRGPAVAGAASWKGYVKDKDLTAPPGSPTEDDSYIVASPATGSWAGHEDDIVTWDGAQWIFETPAGGWTLWVEDETEIYVFNGTSWAQESFGPHAATHAENAPDEIEIEDLGTASATAGHVPIADGAGGLDMGPVGMDYICVIDEKTPSTAGGDFLSGAWRTRDLTVEQADTGNHAALASNQITLQPGKYAFHISAPAYKVGRHQTALYDVTDTAHVLTGSSEDADTIDDVQTRSVIAGFRSFNIAHIFEIQHRCETNRSADGLGLASGFGLNEVYTVVEIWRLGDF